MMTSDLYQHKQVPQDIVIQLTGAWKRGVTYKMTVQESPKSNNLPTLWLRSHSAQGTLAVWDFGSVFTLDTLAALKRLPILALTTFRHSSNKNMALITSLSSQTPFRWEFALTWPPRNSTVTAGMTRRVSMQANSIFPERRLTENLKLNLDPY
jgi:hypothetical protein